MSLCGTCGEVLPHYCAPRVRVRRDLRRRGHRTVTITDRARPAASGPAGWQPTYVVDVLALQDMCEAIDGPGPEWYREAADGAA